MRTTTRAFFATLAVTAFSMTLPAAAQTTRGKLAFEPCSFDRVEVPVKCATFQVPVDHDEPGGATLDLRIGFLPATEGASEPPVFLIQGGPGAPSTGLIRIMQGHPARGHRDFVFVDQRGTGASHPLNCPMRPGSPDPISSARGCAPRFEVDLARFTTRDAVRDLNAVREAMGYETVSLMGGSYGTRVALDHLRIYPTHTESVIVDAVVPPGYVAPVEIPLAASAALEGWISECEKDAACASAYPELRSDLRLALERLEKEPVEMQMRSPSGQTRSMTFDADRFRMTLFRMLYRSRTAVEIPATIHQAAQGDVRSLAMRGSGPSAQRRPGPGSGSGRPGDAPAGTQGGARGQSRQGPSMAAGMMMTIMCNEDVPITTLEDARKAVEGSLMGDMRIEAMWETCEDWPTDDLPQDFHQPLVSEVPVLIFHSEWDPTIRASAPRELAEGLPNSLIVTMAKNGHTSLSTECNQSIAAQFLARGTAEGLDASCARSREREPFVIR